MDDLAANPSQVERLRRATRKEIEQGISREIGAIDEERKAAVARADAFERECARLAEENEMLKERCRLMSNRERRMVDAIANDAYAATFQTMGQYRTALLKMLRGEQA
ncbi:hypothetical protein MW7_007190 [Imbroritus primus]|uniref:Uncharacterized protein n=1 Tax=Imbroritus primus TaxID=3058603 RepID=A0ACD3SQK8_9BURK|nr:hypothetical protein MW7_007190 [Burkholderiaceae bacterium PBA]